ncbi:hypothetical protein B7R54_04240 [Subtercola boreus]|uniref:ABC transporter domain-containing protein n=1 Tax=Subtercola boreus TaxID=120213 RepID=A0A3E0VGM2_9MICO|nr:ATP-binding cassette domain-containing protein [Subtercola boreus]RFA08520.1 hypothetical protein B7R54_04240 [Subtercola boreus]TQL54552.1 branched-chain amino acid transport system ATP-binding protein [Subtercola boreus]
MTELLAGRNLTKQYGGVRAVTNVDISLAAGEVLGLVGPNGAGKTTLVDLIYGTQVANSGTLTLSGQDLSGPPSKRARAGLARTYQHPLLASSLTVRENLVVGTAGVRHATIWQMVAGFFSGVVRGGNSEGRAEVEALAAEIGLNGLDRPVKDLSLGEQRLVEVVRALGQKPLVLILDEPFAGADSSGIASIAEAIRIVKSRGHAVILIDHNVDLVSEIVDRIILMQQGEVVFDGNPIECLASPQMKLVYFGEEHS